MLRSSVVLLPLLLSACQADIDPQVVSLVGSDRINREITLDQMTEAPAPQVFPGTFELILRNHSSKQFLTPTGFVVRIFVNSDASGTWVEVEDRTIYLPANAPIVLEPRGNAPRR